MGAVRGFVEETREAGGAEDPSGLTMSAFLTTVSLSTDQDSDDTGSEDRVTLMTVHSAKGLEFNNVFIVGVEDGLFPSSMAQGSRGRDRGGAPSALCGHNEGKEFLHDELCHTAFQERQFHEHKHLAIPQGDRPQISQRLGHRCEPSAGTGPRTPGTSIRFRPLDGRDGTVSRLPAPRCREASGIIAAPRRC